MLCSVLKIKNKLRLFLFRQLTVIRKHSSFIISDMAYMYTPLRWDVSTISAKQYYTLFPHKWNGNLWELFNGHSIMLIAENPAIPPLVFKIADCPL